MAHPADVVDPLPEEPRMCPTCGGTPIVQVDPLPHAIMTLAETQERQQRTNELLLALCELYGELLAYLTAVRRQER